MNRAKPIIFSGKMIEAILKGEKTQTRRPVKRPRVVSDTNTYYPIRAGGRWWWAAHGYSTGIELFCPYGYPRNRLWIRETFTEIVHGEKVIYRADCDDYEASIIKWTPSIFMPRWASRIALEIVRVRVEQLQSISPADCVSEGIEQDVCLVVYPPTPKRTREAAGLVAKTRFIELWDSINAKRSYSWESNPWVWVIEFKVVKQ